MSFLKALVIFVPVMVAITFLTPTSFTGRVIAVAVGSVVGAASFTLLLRAFKRR